MTSLKTYMQKNSTQESTPNLAEGQKFGKILSATFKPTKYKNSAGEKQDAVVVVTDSGIYHSTAKAIVDIIRKYFAENTEPLENVQVIEKRSADGRLYLTLEGF